MNRYLVCVVAVITLALPAGTRAQVPDVQGTCVSGCGGGGQRPDNPYADRMRAAHQKRQRQWNAIQMRWEAAARRGSKFARKGLAAQAKGDCAAAGNDFRQELASFQSVSSADLGEADSIWGINKGRYQMMQMRQQQLVGMAQGRLTSVQSQCAPRQSQASLQASAHKNAKLKPGKVKASNASVPALQPSISAQSVPAGVLEKRQPDVKEIDVKIAQAQTALKRLIHSNQVDEEVRQEWTAASLEATEGAEKLSLNLVIDLIGAHVDHLAEVNKEDRMTVLNRLMNRTDGKSGASLHNHYGMLVDRKEELERIHSELRLAGKENDLRNKIQELKKADDPKFNREDLWDVVSQFKKVEEFAGPSKDLLDSAYVIYEQEESWQRLSATQADQEKVLAAANNLRKYIVKLEKQKHDERAGL